MFAICLGKIGYIIGMDFRRTLACSIVAIACIFAGFVAGAPNPYAACKFSDCYAPPWYTAFKRPDGMLVLTGIATLIVIAYQSRETARAAKAAQDNIGLIISKERARLRIDLEDLILAPDPEFADCYVIKFKVSIFGTTPAFIVDTKCVAYEAPLELISEENLFYGVMFPLRSLPAVIPANSGPIQEYSIFYSPRDGNSEAIMAEIMADRLFVGIRGFIIYRDVFEGEHETRFRYMWKYSEFQPIPGIKSWGNWQKCGKEQENKET